MNVETSTLALMLLAAAWYDLRERRIPNRLVLAGLVLGPAFGLLDGGLPGVGESLLGAGAGLLVLLPFYAFRLVGAGDAKLMAVVGGFTGTSALLPITLFTFIAGGLLGLFVLLTTHTTSVAVANVRHILYAASLRAHGVPIRVGELGLKTAARLPYALAIASGVACWLATRG